MTPCTLCQMTCNCFTLVTQCLTFAQLSALYASAKSIAIAIMHEGITVTVLQEKLVPASIRFPTGAELEQVMCDLESLCYMCWRNVHADQETY